MGVEIVEGAAGAAVEALKMRYPDIPKTRYPDKNFSHTEALRNEESGVPRPIELAAVRASANPVNLVNPVQKHAWRLA